MGLNPETPGVDQLNAHAVLLSKPEDGLLVLGFEDINRQIGGDHDFNDVLIAIQVTPFTAVERSQVVSLNSVADSDKDGVPDSLDAFPTDPSRASRRYYPSATTFGHLLYEDMWPRQGDYDLNDLVVGYRVTEELNAKDQVVGIKLFYDLMARGAYYPNGFALHLPGIPRDLIQTVDGQGNPTTTLRIGDGKAEPLLPESGQREAVFVLGNDVNALTQTGFSSGDCFYFNTVKTCPYMQPVRLTAEIQFAKPVVKSGSPPYDPFIFSTRHRGREIHLVDQAPTDLADPRLFGQADDRSDPSLGRYYRTQKNLIWALDIPEALDHPLERRDLVSVYPAFANWAESNGRQATDWFFWQRDESGVFLRPKNP
jgi:LruC domain-containing protein